MTVEKLIKDCKYIALHCSVTHQRINDHSIEIYRGYAGKSYDQLFYTDGHTDINEALQKAFDFLNEYKRENGSEPKW